LLQKLAENQQTQQQQGIPYMFKTVLVMVFFAVGDINVVLLDI
jgi:hypothetical protein